MTSREAIQKLIETGQEQEIPADWTSLNRQRNELQAEALKLTDQPVVIFTRSDPDTFQFYFLVRFYDKSESVQYADVEKEAKEKGWTK